MLPSLAMTRDSEARCNDLPIWTLPKLLASLPRLPGDMWRVAPSVRGRVISGALREAVMLAVAAENRCRHCQLAHATFGQAAGLSAAEVEDILANRDLPRRPERERLALAYARDLARREFASRDESLRAQLLERWTPKEVEAIEATARLMNLANRFGNTFDAGLARIRGGDPSGASALDVAVLSPLFLAGAAAVSPIYLATKLLVGRRK